MPRNCHGSFMRGAYGADLFRGDATMPFDKTEKGRAALLDRPVGMGMLERRALILADGKRGREHLLALLGPDIQPGLDRLLGDGYLVDTAARSPTSKPVLAIMSPLPTSAMAPAAPALPVAVSITAGTSAAQPPAPRSRRSLAASKMYMVDMLQLQRDPESVSLKAELQTSPSEDELVWRLVRALRHIQAVATASYALRIAERLAEILPEAHLSRLAFESNPTAQHTLESVA